MKYLIVNADDFGLTEGINRAIIECYKNGILRSTSIMCNMSYAKEAFNINKLCPNLGFGIHITLDAGKPLNNYESVNTLVDERGFFKKGLPQCLNDADIYQIKIEIEEQIKKAFSLGIRITHMDSHHHVQNHPKVADIFMEMAHKYKLPVRSTPLDKGRIVRSGLKTPDDFIYAFYGDGVYKENLLDIIRNLQDGINEMMTHPGYLDDELFNISSYNKNREIEKNLITDEDVLNVVLQSNIILVNYSIFNQN